MARKTVFVTGGTGVMGWSAVCEMLKHPNKINIKLLVRENDKHKDRIIPLLAKPNVRVIWGDLLDYESVLEGVTGADYVLHIGGMVSPSADAKPYLTQKTNIGSAENICKAVLAQKNADDIKVCYIGSVAETGGRNYPIHWGRCGDPIKISVYDHYAVSKAIAERIFVESGIKNWVVLRQTGILYPHILKTLDPIMFHVPLNGVIEWCTVEDAGRVMCSLVLKDQSGELENGFWRHFYNISSGKEYRISNYEFISLMVDTLGLSHPEKLFEPNWFATKNFHGHFFADSDKLEEFLQFRENVPLKDYFIRLAGQLDFRFKFARNISKDVVSAFAKPIMKAVASSSVFGTLKWIETDDKARINAFFGSMENWKSIPEKWEDFEIMEFDKDNSAAEQFRIDHGYDERKAKSALDIEDMKTAAKFRGGECLSEAMETGDLYSKLKWKCGHCGAEFEASPALILLGGHWCPECFIPHKCWDYNSIAKTNPFFAQVWYPSHLKEETDSYDFVDLFNINGVAWDDLKMK
ncbi:MAG: NAD(P)-dependent oxidoreductase [Eubacterium sp.]|nr:NAD(P)-dependent oxidoreductase [Eubacterium sp.]